MNSHGLLSKRLVQLIWMIIALVLVSGFSFFYIYTFHPMKQLLLQDLSTKRMDAFLSELTVKQFNTDGRLLHHLHAPMVRHVPEKNTYLLTKPHLIVTEANQAPWEIRADQGIAEADRVITLSQQVMIQQKSHQANPQVTLTTEEITYFPKSKLASTLKPVTIQQAENQIQAIGMNAYLDDHKVELLSHVRGHYEPQKTDSKA